MNCPIKTWSASYSNQLNFNKVLKEGNYKQLSELIDLGYTWQGSKEYRYLSGFVLPKNSIEFSKMIKIILDLEITDEDNPISFRLRTSS